MIRYIEDTRKGLVELTLEGKISRVELLDQAIDNGVVDRFSIRHCSSPISCFELLV